jgi:hypothetical protein
LSQAEVAAIGNSLVDFIRRMEIEHVVYVDDAYDRGPDLEAAIVWIGTQHRARIKNYFDRFNVDLDPEDEELPVTLRTWLEDEGNQEAAERLLAQVLTDRVRAKDHVATDRLVTTRFGELLEGYRGFIPIGPEEWDQRQTEILGWLAQERVLLIFDDDLGQDHTSGSDILDTLIRGEPPERLLLGLLSYNIKEGQENEVTKDWKAKGCAIPVTGIAKEAIAGEDGPGELVLRVRAAILWKESEGLRSRVDAHMESAIAAASQKVRDLTALDFDEAVFQASRLEGAHEADSLLRLYASLVMAQLRERLRSDHESLRDLATLRAFSDVEREHRRPGSEAWKLQREELYESGTYVNGCHMPTDVGDVYRLTSPPPAEANAPSQIRDFVLVAPPCDVAVRTEGKRKAWTGILCQISPQKPSSGMSLDFFDGETGETHWVNVAKWIPIPLWVLDFCATNRGGLSTFDVTSEAPEVLSEGWKARHVELCDFATKMLGRHLKQPAADGAQQTQAAPAFSSYELDDGSSIKFSCEENKLTFGVERRLRLSPLLARELVETYSRYVSRPARPHALTLELRRTEEEEATGGN